MSHPKSLPKIEDLHAMDEANLTLMLISMITVTYASNFTGCEEAADHLTGAGVLFAVWMGKMGGKVTFEHDEKP